MTRDDEQPGATERAFDDGTADRLVREEPLLIRVDDRQLLTMRTPGDDAALALGFLLSEGIVTGTEQVTDVLEQAGDAGERRPDTITLRLDRAARRRATGRLTRTHEIRTSCGICGLTDADDILDDLPPLLPGVPRFAPAAIEGFRTRFEAEQRLFRVTGASHAAILFGADGAVLGGGEDVGRHNALDKAIGRAALAGHDLGRAIAVLSGRAGFDLVLKCLRVRVPVILSVSATSSLSLDVCRTAGATLVGFVRPGRHRIYCDAGRIAPEGGGG